MLYQLSDFEFAVLDSLADGALQFSLLVRELRRRKQTWEPAVALTAFNRLLETQLIRCACVPGAPTTLQLSYETIKTLTAHLPEKEEQVYWMELTDDGKTVWENWQQAA